MVPLQTNAYRRCGAWLVPLALASGTRCAPRFHLAFETAHFQYYVEDGVIPPCAGAAEWIESYGKAVAEFMGQDAEVKDKTQFYQYLTISEVLAEGCVAANCTTGVTVRAVTPLSRHEIVHTYTDRIGSPPLFLEEGLATALGCELDDLPTNASVAPLEEAVTTDVFLQDVAASLQFHLRSR